MSWPGRRRAARTLAWIGSRGRARALILGYHRIGPEGFDPHELSLPEAVFERHLAVLGRLARPVRLSNLVSDVRSGRIPERAFALTFDDGYAHTLSLVEPLLKRHGIPATVFVPTGLLGAEPWWDRLARLMSTSKELPSELVLPLAAGGERRRPVEADERRPSRGGGSRIDLTNEIYRAMLRLPDQIRVTALNDIETRIGVTGHEHRVRVVSESELVALDRSDVLDVGSHSVSHPVLTELPREARYAELVESRKELEDLLRHPVDLFSYPNGVRDPETDHLVQRAGYRGACMSRPGVATARSDPFSLPRFWPGSDPEEVDLVIRRWL